MHNSVVLIGVAVILVATTIGVALLRDQVRFARHRGATRDDFIEQFRSDGIPAEISGIVYDHYRSLARSKRFAVSAGDSYAELFHMVHEDIDDDAEYLVTKLGMEMPIEPVLHEWTTEIKTIGDMVRWINWIRTRQKNNN